MLTIDRLEKILLYVATNYELDYGTSPVKKLDSLLINIHQSSLDPGKFRWVSGEFDVLIPILSDPSNDPVARVDPLEKPILQLFCKFKVVQLIYERYLKLNALTDWRKKHVKENFIVLVTQFKDYAVLRRDQSIFRYFQPYSDTVASILMPLIAGVAACGVSYASRTSYNIEAEFVTAFNEISTKWSGYTQEQRDYYTAIMPDARYKKMVSKIRGDYFYCIAIALYAICFFCCAYTAFRFYKKIRAIPAIEYQYPLCQAANVRKITPLEMQTLLKEIGILFDW